MNIVKGLLLGSAASLVAVAGAQAADLPVKAKPVEYVKVCSLYGAGFFYIPGTDTCIKIGGAVRVQAEYNAGAGGVPVGFGSSTEAAQGRQTRFDTNDIDQRTRIYFSVDARQQTEYGTLRTYFRFGVQQTTPSDPTTGTVFWDRAFIQFAGFTVGKTVSFFDGFSTSIYNYNNPRTMADTGPNGITVWAYTAQFGNGISATLSAEDPSGRGKSVTNANLAGTWALGALTSDAGLAAQSGTNNGFLYPDIVGALRVDQAWGSAQLMGAMRCQRRLLRHDHHGRSAVRPSQQCLRLRGWRCICHQPADIRCASNVNSSPMWISSWFRAWSRKGRPLTPPTASVPTSCTAADRVSDWDGSPTACSTRAATWS